MNITITKNELPIPVTILHLEGKLDRSNYESLIEEAENVYDSGARNLILDLSQLTFISSAGLASLHQVALLFRGEKQSELDQGWAAFHSIDRDRDCGTEAHVKLFSPTKEVLEELDMTGFSKLFAIFSDLDQAALSFRQAVPAT